MNQAGIVLVAVAGLWIAYLVPHRSRYRQQLLESRADDRFSEHLRVLRVAHAAGRGAPARPGRGTDAAPGTGTQVGRQIGPQVGTQMGMQTGTHSTSGVRLHPARRGGGGPMDRPHATTDRVVADAARRSAAERAQRVAHLARRRAAARRRALLTAVLLVAAVAGWSAVAAAGATVALGAVPSVGLLAVLGLGRAAVRAAARSDARWAAGAGSRVPLPGATAGARTVGRSVHPSDARTEVLARVPRTGSPVSASGTAVAAGAPGARQQAPDAMPTRRGRSGAPAAAGAPPAAEAGAPAGAGSATWAPVPVPPPSYTLKPSAPRREPAPLPADEHLATPVATAGGSTAASGPGSATPAVSADTAADGPAALDLDAILARRRASGE